MVLPDDTVPRAFAEARSSLQAAIDLLERAERQAQAHAEGMVQEAAARALDITGQAERRVADLERQRTSQEQHIALLRAGLADVAERIEALLRAAPVNPADQPGTAPNADAATPVGDVGSRAALRSEAEPLRPVEAASDESMVAWEAPRPSAMEPSGAIEAAPLSRPREATSEATAPAGDAVSALRAALERLSRPHDSGGSGRDRE